MSNDNVYLAFCIVGSFADGARLRFHGVDEAQAVAALEDAQSGHGDITWWDYVTDENYDHGRYYKTLPPPPEILQIDLTEL